MNRHADDEPLNRRALRSLALLGANRPRTVLLVMFLSAIAAAIYAIGWMKFKTERADLIDPSVPFQQRWLQYADTFGDTSEVVVVVESAAPETIKFAMDDLGERLQSDSRFFRGTLYKIEPGELPSKGLQFQSPAQLEFGLERIEEFQPIIRGEWDLLQLDTLVRRLGYQIRRQTDQGRDPQLLLHHTELLAASLARSARDPNEFRNPWPELVPIDPRMRESAQEVIYLMNDSGTMGFLKTYMVRHEQNFNGATASLDRLREHIQKSRASHPGVSFGLTGIPILENDEMRESQGDMMIASLVSVGGVGLILLVGFRGFRHPLLTMIMLGVAMAWSFGYTTLAIGHLNILSVSFAAILIGLGIDFGIHYLARYLELRHETVPLKPALSDTSSSVGTGILTAAITTSLAFFCASVTPFLGVAELGIIAGGGILLCALATFLVLPALITLADKNVEPRKLPTPFEGNWLRATISKAPWIVLLASILGIGAVGSRALQFDERGVSSRVRYDSNLLNLQAEGLESVEIQKRIFQEARHSLLYAVSLADSPEEARELARKFESLPEIHHVEELGSRIPQFPPSETQLLVQAFGAQLARLPERPPQITVPTPVQAGQEIESLFEQLKSMPQAAAAESVRLLDSFLESFAQLPAQSQQEFLSGFQYRMEAALLNQFRGLKNASNSVPVTLSDFPPELTSRFVSPQGRWLVQVYPRTQIWDVEPLGEFVKQVRSVDPDATGTPLQNLEASRQIKKSYQQAAIYALAIIAAVLMIDFLDSRYKLVATIPSAIVVGALAWVLHARNVEIEPVWLVLAGLAMIVTVAAILDFRDCRDAMLALIPPIAGSAIMFGLLVWLGVDLNPANLIVLPLILGIGVDDGVHVVHDYREQGRTGYRPSSSTINAIILTSLTSMIGFGSMMIASHRGLYSVGLVLVIGVGSCLLVSLVTLPAILTILSRRAGSAVDKLSHAG
ncbi:MAG TPA: MMPL family transporter [Planctomycetaceae bacterium]|nr:MMPL family transporter [Planctomycetaceae bacterium]